MLIQKLNRDDADKVFVLVRNVSGGTLTAGYPVCWDTGTPDGVRVTKPGVPALFVGILPKTLADSKYGLAQAYGYCGAAFVSGATNATIAVGDNLIPVAGSFHLVEASGATALAFVFAAEAVATVATPAAANKKVFVKAL